MRRIILFVLTLFLVCTLPFLFLACQTTTDPQDAVSDSDTEPPETPTITPSIQTIDIADLPAPEYPELLLNGKTYPNLTFEYAQLPSGRLEEGSVNSYLVQDLGDFMLEDYPIDMVYDFAPWIMYQDGIYRMWWTRQCPHDTIWYAESTDLKNWTNSQIVLSLVNVVTPWAQEQLAFSSVLYVNGLYYLYFESVTSQACGVMDEYVNNVFLATSQDGIHWTMYPSNEDPYPVIRCKDGSPGLGSGIYGVGQPNAFYLNDTFYLYYTDASGNYNYTRLAKSTDGIHFEGELEDHPIVIDRAASVVQYNPATKKFYCSFAIEPINFYPDKHENNDTYIYIMESDDGENWPFNKIKDAAKYLPAVQSGRVTLRTSPSWVANEYGHIHQNGGTSYMAYMEGNLIEGTVRQCDSDIHFVAMNFEEFLYDPIQLPNGKPCTQENLINYYNIEGVWKAPAVTAERGMPIIDGLKDDLYTENGTAPIHMTAQFAPDLFDVNPTDTKGSVSFLFDGENLYLFAEITDNNVITTGSPITNRDGFTIHLDKHSAIENKNRTTAHSTLTFSVDGKNSSRNVIDSVTTITDTGYTIEACIQLKDKLLQAIAQEGALALDLTIHENQGEEGVNSDGRDSVVVWSDYLCEQDSTIARFGTLNFAE